MKIPFMIWTIMGILVVNVSTGFTTSREKLADPVLPIVITASDRDPYVTEMVIMHTYKGGLLFIQGDLDGAIHEFREAIRLSPDSPVPHNNVAMVLHLQDYFSEAQADLLIAIESAPSYAPAYSNLGFVLFDHGDLAAAVERWKSGVQLDPNMPSAWSGLAIGLLAMGHVDQAAQSYRQALKLDAQFADMDYLHHVRRWSSRARTQAALLLNILKYETSTRHQNELLI